MRVINIVKLIRATFRVFFVPCCPVLLPFYLFLSYMFELNKWNGMEWNGCFLRHSVVSVFTLYMCRNGKQTLTAAAFMIAGACTGEDVTSSMTEDNSERRDNDGQRQRRLQRRRRRRQLCGHHSDGTELTRNTSSSAVSEGQGDDDDGSDDDDDDDHDDDIDEAAAATTLTTTTENVELDVSRSDELEQRGRVELVFRTPICSLSATE